MIDSTYVAGQLTAAAARLERLASEATHGEDPDLYDSPGWTADEDPGCTEPGDPVPPVIRTCDGEIVAVCQRRADADLIAALGPHTVAALVPLLQAVAGMARGDWHCTTVEPCEHRGCWAIREAAEIAGRILDQHAEQEAGESLAGQVAASPASDVDTGMRPGESPGEYGVRLGLRPGIGGQPIEAIGDGDDTDPRLT